MRVDGKPVDTWEALLRRGGFADKVQIVRSDFHRRVLPPGETVHAFRLHDDGGKEINGGGAPDSLGRRLERALGHASFEICYCSTLDDCWINANGETSPVRRCPAPSSDTFQQ